MKIKSPLTPRVIRPALARLLLLAAVLGSFAPARAQPLLARAQPASARPDRILVKPHAGLDLSGLHRAIGTRALRAFPAIGNLQVVQLPRGVAASAVLAAFRASGFVDYAEPDFVVHVLITPNDFHYYNLDLWNLHNTGQYGGKAGADIHAPQGWDVQHAAPNLIVAVVDTGIRLTHEDLAPNLWTNPGESGTDASGLDKNTNLRDDDGDGFIDDVHGINAIAGTGDPTDDYGHGTHVAGILGARGNNTVGIAGVAWQVQIMACKFIDASGNGTISDAITCLDYARTHGAKIVNASWGAYAFQSAALFDAIDALRDAGILFVAACGNDNNNNDTNPLYPASYALDNVIAVAATDRTDNRAWFSNYGAKTVHLGAPGSPVFSCWNGSDSDYRYDDGTSMAAPHVTGALALVWARFPSETYFSIRRRVLTNTDPLTALAGKTVSGGRLDLYKALTHTPPNLTLPIVTVVASDPAAAEAGSDPGTIRVSRTGNTDKPLTVYYTLTGTAQNGADYQTLSGVVTIPTGKSSANVIVVPIDDTAVEGPETVVLTLNANAAYTVGPSDSAIVTIADNDAVPAGP